MPRQLIYKDQLFVYSPRPSSVAFCEFTRDLNQEAFVSIVGSVGFRMYLKRRFIESCFALALLWKHLVTISLAIEADLYQLFRGKVYD